MKKITAVIAASALIASSTFAFAGGPVEIQEEEEPMVIIANPGSSGSSMGGGGGGAGMGALGASGAAAAAAAVAVVAVAAAIASSDSGSH